MFQAFWEDALTVFYSEFNPPVFLRSLFNTGYITNITLSTASFFMNKFHNDLPPPVGHPKRWWPIISAPNTKWSFKPPPKKGTFIANPCWKSTPLTKNHGNVAPKEDLSTISFFAPKPFGNKKREYLFQEIHFWIHLYIYWFLQLYSISCKVLKARAFGSRCFFGLKPSQWLGEKGLYTQFSHFGRCNESVRNNPLKFEKWFFAFWPEPERRLILVGGLFHQQFWGRLVF